jgi:hypothetical protein
VCFQNQKFIVLISIIKVFAIKMMTYGTPWNFQPPLTRVHFNTNYMVTRGNQNPPIFKKLNINQ